MRLKSAMLFVSDIDRMAAFYGGALGLTEVTRSPGWIEYAEGFALHAIPPEIAAGISTTEVREETPIKLIFETDTFESRLQAIEAAGARLMRKPWGGCDCVDPEGNVFHLALGSDSGKA